MGCGGGGGQAKEPASQYACFGLLAVSKSPFSLFPKFCSWSTRLLRKDYHQSFAQPDFGEELKKGLSGDFLLIFLCLRPKRSPEKSARNPGYQ